MTTTFDPQVDLLGFVAGADEPLCLGGAVSPSEAQPQPHSDLLGLFQSAPPERSASPVEQWRAQASPGTGGAVVADAAALVSPATPGAAAAVPREASAWAGAPSATQVEPAAVGGGSSGDAAAGAPIGAAKPPHMEAEAAKPVQEPSLLPSASCAAHAPQAAAASKATWDLSVGCDEVPEEEGLPLECLRVPASSASSSAVDASPAREPPSNAAGVGGATLEEGVAGVDAGAPDVQFFAGPAPRLSHGQGAPVLMVLGEVGRRYLVRCRGRWRIRAAPSMVSRILGTVAAGSVVVATAVAAPSPPPWGAHIAEGADAGGSGDEEEECGRVGWPASSSSSTLSQWVRVLRFEVRSPTGIVLKHQGGEPVFCYRRNKQGHGLYEIGEESAGELRTLTGEVPRGLAEYDEPSTTWKILGAAEVMSNMLNPASWSWDLTSACSAVEKPLQKERPPDKVFERRQREQLREGARTARERLLAYARAALVAPPACDTSPGVDVGGVGGAGVDALLIGDFSEPLAASVPLHSGLGSRFARLRMLVQDVEDGTCHSCSPTSALLLAAAASKWPSASGGDGTDGVVGADAESGSGSVGVAPTSPPPPQVPLKTCGEAAVVLDRLEALKRVETWLQRELVATCSTLSREIEEHRLKLRARQMTQRQQPQMQPVLRPALGEASGWPPAAAGGATLGGFSPSTSPVAAGAERPLRRPADGELVAGVSEAAAQAPRSTSFCAPAAAPRRHRIVDTSPMSEGMHSQVSLIDI